MSGLAPPSPYQWSVADVATAAVLNAQLYTGLTFLLGPPIAIYAQTSAQAVASTTATAITWPTPSVDTYGGYSAGSPTRYTPQQAGYYLTMATVAYAPNATGGRGAAINKNGSTLAQSTVGSAGSVYATNAPIVFPVYCNGTTDYLEIGAAQNSGVSLNTQITVTNFAAFFIHV
ncbi:hypothetical protein ABIA32_002680 [Streptacidiphilus sp. MAP12-20]|uniref:hypothetical protein n=1 Tax=Streptacidiphilus sp. MAP12-20 TaxID=3156299 RepID=UPI0035143869